MPTISRPETDNQLLQALEAAKLKSDVTLPGSLAFSAVTLTKLITFLPNFRQQMQERGVALSVQSESTTTANKAKARLVMFISHFFQVFNFGILRGVFTQAQRAHYQLDVNQEELPRLITEQEIQMWGNRIVAGETTRTAAGFPAMSMPSAAEVAAELSIVVSTQGDQSTKKDILDSEQEDVAELREEANDIISDIWDEVEFTFRKDTPPSKRRKAREYGVVYEPRTGETPSPDEYSLTGKCTEDGTGIILNDVEIIVVETGAKVFSNAEGNYFVPTQPSGTYNLEARKPGYNNSIFSGVVITDGAITTLNIVMKKSSTPPVPPLP